MPDRDHHDHHHDHHHQHHRRHPPLVAGIATIALVVAACSGGESDIGTGIGSDTDTVTIATLPPWPSLEPGAASDASEASGTAGSSSPTTISTTDPTTTTELAEVAVRLDVAPQFLGFAGTQGLTGGQSHPIVLVTSCDDSGTCTYR